MSDRPVRSEEIGDALARAIDPKADRAKRAIWRILASVLDGAFDAKPIFITADPTSVEAYMPDGRWCWARTLAWQLNPATNLPVALWVKASDEPLDWERIWPAVGVGDHKFSVDAADEAAAGYDYAESKIAAGTGIELAKITGSHGKAMRISCTVTPGADDHLVKARVADATTVGGLLEKTGPSDTITPELYTDPVTGVERVRFNAAPPQPTTGGSWLYTGSIQESNLLDPVKAFVKSLEGMGGLDPGQSELFTVLENGDYEHKAVGQLYGLAPDGTQTFTLAQGQRVWLTTWLGATDSVYHGGLCTVQTLGDGSTKAVLRPTADVLEVGSMFKVEGSGAQFEGWYWEVLSLPDKTLAYRPEYVNATTYNLFTSTNVNQAGSATRETSVTIPGGTSGGTMFEIPLFEMLDVLGVSTIPKGVVNWEIKAYVVTDDPTATVFVRAFLSLDQGVLSRFGYADTRPLHSTSPTVIQCQGAIPADLACNPSDKLCAVFYGYSNSASEVTIKLVYNDASHSTRVQTPLTTASYGTLSHQLLTPESRGFPDTEQGRADAAVWRHEQDDIKPGRILTPSNAMVTTASGLFAVPSNSNYVELDGTEDLIGCSTAGWTGTNSEIEIYCFTSRKILKAQNPLPDGYASFAWGAMDTGYLADYDVIDAYANSVYRFRLIGGNWRLCSSFNV